MQQTAHGSAQATLNLSFRLDQLSRAGYPSIKALYMPPPTQNGKRGHARNGKRGKRGQKDKCAGTVHRRPCNIILAEKTRDWHVFCSNQTGPTTKRTPPGLCWTRRQISDHKSRRKGSCQKQEPSNGRARTSGRE